MRLASNFITIVTSKKQWILQNIAKSLSARSALDVRWTGYRPPSGFVHIIAQARCDGSEDLVSIHHLSKNPLTLKAGHIVTHSLSTYDTLTGEHGCKCETGVSLVRYGVDTKLFGRIKYTPRKVVGFVGRPHHRKRLDIFASVMSKLKDWTVTMYLNRRDTNFIDPIRKRVSVVKKFSPKIYGLFGVYLCTSSIEGGPYPLMEASSSGIPCVSTDVGVATELLHPKCVVKRGEGMIDELADAVVYARDNALEVIEYQYSKLPMFTIDAMSNGMDKLYVKLLEKNGLPVPWLTKKQRAERMKYGCQI